MATWQVKLRWQQGRLELTIEAAGPMEAVRQAAEQLGTVEFIVESVHSDDRPNEGKKQ